MPIYRYTAQVPTSADAEAGSAWLARATRGANKAKASALEMGRVPRTATTVRAVLYVRPMTIGPRMLADRLTAYTHTEWSRIP